MNIKLIYNIPMSYFILIILFFFSQISISSDKTSMLFCEITSLNVQIAEDFDDEGAKKFDATTKNDIGDKINIFFEYKEFKIGDVIDDFKLRIYSDGMDEDFNIYELNIRDALKVGVLNEILLNGVQFLQKGLGRMKEDINTLVQITDNHIYTNHKYLSIQQSYPLKSLMLLETTKNKFSGSYVFQDIGTGSYLYSATLDCVQRLDTIDSLLNEILIKVTESQKKDLK